MSDTKYRLIFLGLGVAFVGVVVVGFLLGSPDREGVGLPAAIEEIGPLPSTQVPLQTPIEVDVPVGYRIEMFVDNFRVPTGELLFVEGTGVYRFNPHQSSVIAWGPGEHTVLVRWHRIGGLPDEGEYSWSFRVF